MVKVFLFFVLAYFSFNVAHAQVSDQAKSHGWGGNAKTQVAFKKEKGPDFLPDPSFLGPNKVQIGHHVFESYAEFLKSEFGPLSSKVPEIKPEDSRYVVAKVVSIVEKPANIFAADENYTDDKIYELFPLAHPTRVPGTNTFRCDLETGYANLEIFGIKERILFTAFLEKITLGAKSKILPEQNIFYVDRKSTLPITFVFQPGVDYNFLMNSSLSAYSFSPCYAEACGSLNPLKHTLVTSYQVFALRKKQPAILAIGSYLFEPGEGLAGTVIANLKGSIPSLLDRFYNIDKPIQQAYLQNR